MNNQEKIQIKKERANRRMLKKRSELEEIIRIKHTYCHYRVTFEQCRKVVRHGVSINKFISDSTQDKEWNGELEDDYDYMSY